MRREVRKHYKNFSLLEIFFVIYWLTMLKLSDAYYIPYLIIAVFGIISIYYNSIEGRTNEEKGENLMIFAFSAFLSLMTLAANYGIFLNLNVPENAGIWFVNLYRKGNVIVVFLGGYVAFGNITRCLMKKLKNFCWRRIEYKWPAFLVFLVSFFIISGINIGIMFLCFYPGNISSDSVSIIKQALFGPYSNHQPYYYTKIVEFFLVRGIEWFHDINASVAFFNIFQIIFMAFCISYVIVTLYQMGISLKLQMGCLIWYVAMPFNIMYSFTMWKDVMFGGFVAVFIVSVFRIWKKIGKKVFLSYAVLIIGGIGMCLFRSNGWISFALAFFSFLFLFGEDYGKKKMKFLFLGIMVLTFVLKYPVLQSLNVTQPDMVEKLSVPIQQIARIVRDCGDISEENKTFLCRVVDVDQISEVYRPEISDPIKKLMRETGNQQYLEQNMAAYIKIYLEMSLSHMDKSIEAWIDLTKGYWNGGYSYWRWADWVEGKEDLGLERTVYAKNMKKCVDEYFWLFSENLFLQIFLCIGFHVWIVLILFFFCIVRKDKEGLFLTVPLIAILITLLISTPVYSEFRYVYAIFCCLPFLICSTFYKKVVLY